MREHKNNQRPRNIQFGKQHISSPNNVKYSTSPFPNAQKPKLNQQNPLSKTKTKSSIPTIDQTPENSLSSETIEELDITKQ